MAILREYLMQVRARHGESIYELATSALPFELGLAKEVGIRVVQAGSPSGDCELDTVDLSDDESPLHKLMYHIPA